MTNHDPHNPLTALILRQRTTKPRSQGITMIADWGLGPARQADLLRTSARYIDLAKIAVGIGALLPLEVLREKLKGYREHHITAFPGGQFLEHAVGHRKTDVYLQAVIDAGFDCLEVSDNLLQIPLENKLALIRHARKKYGLHVLGEVGKKEGLESHADPAEDAAGCLDAGAEVVFLEAADFFAGEKNEKQLERIIDRCGLGQLVFELPGPWIKGVTLSEVHETTCRLLERFGPEANVANVDPDNVLKLEALRLNIGVNAGRE
jgi:phosphosulfolactate synthase